MQRFAFSFARRCGPCAFLLGLVGMGCGGKVADLGGGSTATYATTAPPTNAPPSSGTSTQVVPFVLVTEVEPIAAFAVDGEELYWTTERDAQQFGVTLKRCAIENCAASLELVGTINFGSAFGNPCQSTLQVEDDELGYFTTSFTGGELFRFSKLGPSTPEPILTDWDACYPMVNSGRLSWRSSDGVLHSFVISAGEATKVRLAASVPRTGPGTIPLAADEAYLYFTLPEGIARVRQDLAEPYQVLVNEARTVGGVAVVGDTLYWSDALPLGTAKVGSVKACPRSGCAGLPRVVVDSLALPGSLAVDENSLYVVEPLQALTYNGPGDLRPVPGTGRLTRFSLDGAARPWVLVDGREIVEAPKFSQNFAIFVSCKPRTSLGAQPRAVPCSISAVPR